MELHELRQMVARQQVREGVLKPAEEGNGWQVGVEDLEGVQYALTDPGGHRKVYHTIDTATAVLRELGVDKINVIERF